MRKIDKEAMLDLIIQAKRTGPEDGSFAEWLAEYLVERLPTLTPQNDPLTLDELRGMVGCWVWVIVTYQHEGKTFQCDGWALVETPARIAYLDQEFLLTELGTRFRAYKHQVSDFRVRFAPNDL